MRLGPGTNQDTELGPLASAEHLAASVWTSDLRTAHTLAAQINASNVFVNHAPVLDPAAPWGGFKASEYGQEMGRYAIDSYTQLKSVWVNLAG
ncbi:aldehyde dehydrogenase family protein [Nocardiopsis dassonvillei]